MRLIMISVVGALCFASPAVAQERPPRPIEELVREYAADPNEGIDILALAAVCPESGTWQEELLRRILELPDDPTRLWNLAAALKWTVTNCDTNDLVDAWLRRQLRETSIEGVTVNLAAGLYASGREVNRRAARAALFDPRLRNETRTQIGGSMVGADHVEALEQIALGYAEFGTPPPSLFLVNAIGSTAAEGPDGVQAKRRLLQAVLERPDGAGAVRIMNTILSDVLGYDRSHPWFVEVAETVSSISRGHISVSPELRKFVTDRVERFRPSNGGIEDPRDSMEDDRAE